MASRRFFTYDPYDYYYTSPYHYPYPYYQYQHPTQSRGVGGFFPAAAEATPEAARVAPRPRVESSRPVSIPVHFVGSEPEPERGAARMHAAASAAAPKKRVPSAEEAAVRLQAAARGFMARKSVRAVREVEREAEETAGKIAREAEVLSGDARARIGVGEALMRMLLRLDAVRGARDYRRRVTKRVLALQDAVDALERKSTPAVEEVQPEASTVVDTAEESEVAPGQPGGEEDRGETEPKTAPDASAEMEVDGSKADGEAGAVEEADQAQDSKDLDLDHDKQEGSGEWEMVTEEPEPAAQAASESTVARPQEPTTGQGSNTVEAGAGNGSLDTRKVMEMVASLCERSAQQCAVIGALAERVDALERAVRRVEDAERRRRRGKKLRKEGKGSNNSKCYSD